MTRKPGNSTSSTSRRDVDSSRDSSQREKEDSLLDLPEGPLPADSGEADDLLASLADEQISRLALDDGGRENIEADEARTGFAELTPEEAAALRAGDDGPPPPITQDSPEDETVTSMPTDDELDALLRGDDPTAAKKGRLEVEAAPASEDLTDAAAELAAELDSQPETIGRGREEAEEDEVAADEAVEARRGINTVEPAAVEDQPEATPGAAAPWYLRPLIWLNAPLAGAPETVRDVVGKIALMTLLNAVAVLIYVFVIRR